MTSPQVEIRPATLADAAVLDLRAADRAEVEALSGREPQEVLAESVERSAMAWAGCADGKLVCLFGVVPVSLAGVTGVPWLLGSDDVCAYSRAFLRCNKAYVRDMLHEFPVLRNVVDARNEVSINWLKWLGFELDAAEPMGVAGLPFHRFEMRREWADRTGLVIEESTVARVAGSRQFPALAAEYTAQSAPDALPLAARVESYRKLEALGALRVISATLDGRLIGVITVLVAPVPHYSGVVAVSESFFVAKAHRKSGAGLRLLRAAETHAAAKGAPILLVSAPSESDLVQILPRIGYAEVGRTFLKKVSP